MPRQLCQGSRIEGHLNICWGWRNIDTGPLDTTRWYQEALIAPCHWPSCQQTFIGKLDQVCPTRRTNLGSLCNPSSPGFTMRFSIKSSCRSQKDISQAGGCRHAWSSVINFQFILERTFQLSNGWIVDSIMSWKSSDGRWRHSGGLNLNVAENFEKWNISPDGTLLPSLGGTGGDTAA